MLTNADLKKKTKQKKQ